jgi:hypothetical protein
MEKQQISTTTLVQLDEKTSGSNTPKPITLVHNEFADQPLKEGDLLSICKYTGTDYEETTTYDRAHQYALLATYRLKKCVEKEKKECKGTGKKRKYVLTDYRDWIDRLGDQISRLISGFTSEQIRGLFSQIQYLKRYRHERDILVSVHRWLSIQTMPMARPSFTEECKQKNMTQLKTRVPQIKRNKTARAKFAMRRGNGNVEQLYELDKIQQIRDPMTRKLAMSQICDELGIKGEYRIKDDRPIFTPKESLPITQDVEEMFRLHMTKLQQLKKHNKGDHPFCGWADVMNMMDNRGDGPPSDVEDVPPVNTPPLLSQTQLPVVPPTNKERTTDEKDDIRETDNSLRSKIGDAIHSAASRADVRTLINKITKRSWGNRFLDTVKDRIERVGRLIKNTGRGIKTVVNRIVPPKEIAKAKEVVKKAGQHVIDSTINALGELVTANPGAAIHSLDNRAYELNEHLSINDGQAGRSILDQRGQLTTTVETQVSKTTFAVAGTHLVPVSAVVYDQEQWIVAEIPNINSWRVSTQDTVVGPELDSGPVMTYSYSALNAELTTITSTLRLRNRAIHMERAIELARLTSTGVTNRHGTSSARLALALLLMCNTYTMIDYRGSFLPNQTFVMSQSVGNKYQLVTGAEHFWMHPDHGILASFPVRIMTMGQYSRCLSGELVPLWAVSEWGRNVAVVPINTEDINDGTCNLTWLSAHLEQPINYCSMLGNIYDSKLHEIDPNMVYAEISSNLCAVNGPTDGVILVVADVMEGDCPSVVLSDPYAVVADVVVDGVTHNMITGVDCDIITVINAAWMGHVAVDPHVLADACYAALDRYFKHYGSYSDFMSAQAIAASMYMLYRPLYRKYKNAIEPAEYCSSQSVFIDPDSVWDPHQTEGMIPYYNNLWSNAVGSQGVHFARVRQGASFATISSGDPTILVCIYGNLLTYVHRVYNRNTDAYDLAYECANYNINQAYTWDHMQRGYGIPERWMYDGFETQLRSQPRERINTLRLEFEIALSCHWLVPQITLTYAANKHYDATANYSNVFPLTYEVNSCCRIPHVWALLVTGRADIGVNLGPAVTWAGLGLLYHRMYVNPGPGPIGAHVLDTETYNPVAMTEYANRRVAIQQALHTGGMSRGNIDITNWMLTCANAYVGPVSIPFQDQGSGQCYRLHEFGYPSTRTCDEVEIMIGVLPPMIQMETNRFIQLTLINGQSVLRCRAFGMTTLQYLAIEGFKSEQIDEDDDYTTDSVPLGSEQKLSFPI